MQKQNHNGRIYLAVATTAVVWALSASAQDVFAVATAEPASTTLAESGDISNATPSETVQAEGTDISTASGAGATEPAVNLIGGARVDLGLSIGAFWEDQADGSRSYAGIGVDAGVFSQTRNQRFAFTVATQAEVGDGGVVFDNTAAALSYAMFNRATELSFDLAFNERDVNDRPLDDDFDGDDLVNDAGSEEIHSAAIRLVTGRDARFGTDTALGYRQLDYVDTTNPALVSEIAYTADTELRFTLDRRVELRLFGNWQETESASAAAPRETSLRYGLAGDVLINPTWVGAFSLAITDTETEAVGGSTTENGYQINTSLTRVLPNGTLAFSLARLSEEDSDIDSFRIARDMDLVNDASLSAEIGFAVFDGEEVLPLFGLTYEQEVLRGRTLSVSLTQSGDRTDQNQNILRTAFDASYRQELTPISFWSITGSVAATNVQNGPTDDTERVSLGLTYGHELNRDWDLVLSADQVRTYDNGNQTDDDSLFSLTFERNFSFRP